MSNLPRYPLQALIPVVTGLFWLNIALKGTLLVFLLALLPGLLFVGCGIALLFWTSERQINYILAITVLVGLLLALPLWFMLGFWSGLLLLIVTAFNILLAGWMAITLMPVLDDVPAAELNWLTALKAGADLVILGFIVLWTPLPSREQAENRAAELQDALALAEAKGWLDDPKSYHLDPPPLSDPLITAKRLKGHDCEVLRWESGYEPHADEPGRERWLSYGSNRTANAVLLRHPGEPRPWLVAIHGFQMGTLMFDFQLFPPNYLHHKLGFNLILPTLPLHGPRTIGKLSGDGFFSSNILDTLHAEAQAVWDLRRLLSWIRSQDDQPIATLGYSLGGYNTALLSCFEPELAVAIAGIPMSDISRTIWQHAPGVALQRMEAIGAVRESSVNLLKLVSPLALTPMLPKERRFIFAGLSDQFISPEQVRDLWLHWDKPRTEWYQGSHLVFQDQPGVGALLREGLAVSSLGKQAKK